MDKYGWSLTTTYLESSSCHLDRALNVIADDSNIADDSDDTDISEEFEPNKTNDDDQKIEIE